MPRFSRAGARPRTVSKRHIWFGVTLSDIATVSAGAASIVSVIDPDLAGDLSTRGGTIKRIIAQMVIKPGAISQNVLYRYGIVLLDDDAADAAVIPEMFQDPRDWMYERQGFARSNDVDDGQSYDRFEVDTSTMRKIRQGHMELLSLVENLSTSGTTLQYFIALKALVALG